MIIISFSKVSVFDFVHTILECFPLLPLNVVVFLQFLFALWLFKSSIFKFSMFIIKTLIIKFVVSFFLSLSNRFVR